FFKPFHCSSSMESPVGQFLSQILANHPHLLPVAVEKQLEQLEIDLEKRRRTTRTMQLFPLLNWYCTRESLS
ncbi:hypothetical protein ZOSMA_81G01260, partial [Zostera marina]